jgi:hypothetical protein
VRQHDFRRTSSAHSKFITCTLPKSVRTYSSNTALRKSPQACDGSVWGVTRAGASRTTTGAGADRLALPSDGGAAKCKAQYDRVTPDHDRGLFNNTEPGFGSTSVNVYIVAVDFVFLKGPIMNKLTLIRAAAAAALWVASLGAFAQVAVIVSPKSPRASLTAEQVSAIFLGKSNTRPSGSTAVPTDLAALPARGIFYTKIAGKSPAQVKAAWSRLVFSGKATPPKELASSAEVKKFIAANPDAIGYIEKSAVDSSVKVVFSADQLPGLRRAASTSRYRGTIPACQTLPTS